MQILTVLWERGPSTVREVHIALEGERDTGYSTTLKMMQVMTDKGLLIKDDSQRPQVYRPVLSQEEAQTRVVDDVVQRVFGGAAEKLILRAINSREISPNDVAQIQELLKKLEGGAK
jgi:predicted transcriptional regulator